MHLLLGKTNAIYITTLYLHTFINLTYLHTRMRYGWMKTFNIQITFTYFIQVNGTFEEVMGTVFPFTKYDAEDPVCKWFTEEKGQDISGEDWDALYDAEYLNCAIKGWG